MAFRLEGERSLWAGLERIGRNQFKDALRELSGPAPHAERVHEARKHARTYTGR
jgi:hypothetical protein